MDSPSFPWPEGRRAAISLSWDDARASQATVGLPLLDEYKVRSSFYVVPDAIQSHLARWRQAAADGHEIGNHTIHHPCSGNFEWQPAETMLEGYTLDRLEAELLEANRLIEASLGVRPTTFAYCCGLSFVGRGMGVKSYVPLIAKHFLVGRGYLNEVHNLPARCDLAQIFGIPLDNRPFEAIRPLIDATIKGGGWATFVGHEIGQRGQRLNTSTETLRRICEYLAGKPEVWVDTIATIGRHVAAVQKAQSAA